MADEIEILTKSEDESSWVDLVPSQVSTGYQAQNTNLEALRNGYDLFDVSYSSPNIIVAISGIVDENGLPFVVKSAINIDIDGEADNVYYLRLIAGTNSMFRSLSLVTTPGTWDAGKNGFYESGDRILDTIIVKTSTEIYFIRRIGRNHKLYQMNQNLRTEDSPTFANSTIAGHNIDSELDTLNSRVNQGVKTTDSPTFASINTGDGAKEIGQSNRTSDSMTFNALTLTGALSLRTGVEYNTGAIAYEDSIPLPKGLYMFGGGNGLSTNTYINGGYMKTLAVQGFVYSDGTDTRVYNTAGDGQTHTYYALKF